MPWLWSAVCASHLSSSTAPKGRYYCLAATSRNMPMMSFCYFAILPFAWNLLHALRLVGSRPNPFDIGIRAVASATGDGLAKPCQSEHAEGIGV